MGVYTGVRILRCCSFKVADNALFLLVLIRSKTFSTSVKLFSIIQELSFVSFDSSKSVILKGKLVLLWVCCFVFFF